MKFSWEIIWTANRWVLQCLSVGNLQLPLPYVLFLWEWFSCMQVGASTLYDWFFQDPVSLYSPTPEHFVCFIGAYKGMGEGSSTLSWLDKGPVSFILWVICVSQLKNRFGLSFPLHSLKTGLSLSQRQGTIPYIDLLTSPNTVLPACWAPLVTYLVVKRVLPAGHTCSYDIYPLVFSGTRATSR